MSRFNLGESAIANGQLDAETLTEALITKTSIRTRTASDASEVLRKVGSSSRCDSGYASLESTPDSQRIKTGVWPVKKRLRVFEKPIPPSALARLYDWKVLYSQSLLEAIRKSKATAANVSLKLKYLGSSEADAKLYLVVLCDKAAAKAIKRFFGQSHVRLEFRSEFEVQVISDAPRLLSLSIFDCDPSKSDICGRLFCTENGDQLSLGTIGGAIVVEGAAGPCIYGITTSHVFSCSATESQSRIIANDTDPSSEDGDGGDEEVELEFDPPDDFSLTDSRPELPRELLHIGECFERSAQPGTSIAELDWALIQLDDDVVWNSTFNYAEFCQHPPREFPSQHGLLEPLERRPVQVVSGRSGIQTGSLSSSGSAFSVAGDGLVSSYDLQLDGAKELEQGDSGSWVTDLHNGDVYGHVVAVDAFGEGCVVPMDLILKDITRRLSAQKVRLALAEDIQKHAWRRKQRQSSAGATEFCDSAYHSATSLQLSAQPVGGTAEGSNACVDKEIGSDYL